MGSLSNLYISQSYTSLIHLGSDTTITTASVELQDGLGNGIGIFVNSLGDVSLSGSFSASLQQGYVWVGDGNNRTKLVATSSFIGGATDLTSLNAFTASQETKNATLANVTASLNANTASQQISINALNAFSASENTKASTLASYTGSNDTKWSTLGGQTGSYVTSAITASSLITASVNLNTITFTKGNGSTFAITVNTGSGAGGTDITSLNAFTASQETKNATLATYTGSNDTKWNTLGGQTGSYVTSAITASSIVTASASGTDITFTKGDSSQFTISVVTGSVTSASYAEYAETSSITRNVVVVARNGGASTLAAGTVVHITSAVGDNPVFTTASFDTEALSSNTFGLLRYSSLSGADVEVVVEGVVTGVDTDPVKGFAAGDIVYLSSSGQFTNIQPQAPNQIVTLGQVLRAQQNNGSIYVSINNGWELNELHNVQINNPQTGDLIQYESSSYGLWKNKSISGAGITTTSSFNAYTASQETKDSTLASYTASVDTKFTSVGISTSSLNTFTASQETKDSTLSTYTASVDTKFSTIGTQSGSWGGGFPYTGSASITGSLIITGSAIGNVVSVSVASNTASLDFSKGNYFELTASVSPIRIEVSNLSGGITSTLTLLATTASAITWSANVQQPSGSAYITTVSGSNDILSFVAFNSSKVNVVSTLKMI